MLKAIEENRLEGYNPIYNFKESLLEQNVKKETIAMLTLFELNCWIDNEEEKAELKAMLKNISEKKSKEMREKYSSANIFKQINEAREMAQIQENEVKEMENVTEEKSEKKKDFFSKWFKKRYA